MADEVYIFQQDNALAHRARQRVELHRRVKPKFIAPTSGCPTAWTLNRLITAFGSDSGTSLPHASRESGRSTVEGDE